MSATLSKQISQQIRRIEAQAKEREIPIREIQEAAGIHRRTWDRWKERESIPQMRLWSAVLEAAQKFGVAA